MIGVLIWWVVDARKWFKGPKVNVEHHMMDRAQMGIARKDSKESGKGMVQEVESVST